MTMHIAMSLIHARKLRSYARKSRVVEPSLMRTSCPGCRRLGFLVAENEWWRSASASYFARLDSPSERSEFGPDSGREALGMGGLPRLRDGEGKAMADTLSLQKAWTLDAEFDERGVEGSVLFSIAQGVIRGRRSECREQGSHRSLCYKPLRRFNAFWQISTLCLKQYRRH